MPLKILIIGAGGHAKSCIDVIESTSRYQVAGLVDVHEKFGQVIGGYPVIGTDEDLLKLRSSFSLAHIAFGAIRNLSQRMVLYKKMSLMGYQFPVIQSKYSYVSPKATLGAGTIIMHGVIVNADVYVGENVIINSRALVEHDVRINDGCHISTAAILNGGVVIGERCFVGSGATIVQNLNIKNDSFIKMSSTLIR